LSIKQTVPAALFQQGCDMTIRNGARPRHYILIFIFAALSALATVAAAQPLQNPFDNPFEIPQTKPAEQTPAPSAAQDELPPELRGQRTPGRSTRPRSLPDSRQPRKSAADDSGAATQPSPAEATDDNPFVDDANQPDDVQKMPSPSARPPRDSMDMREPDDTAEMPDADGQSGLPPGVDPALVDKINKLNDAGNFAESIPLMEALAKEHPEFYGAWDNLGKAYRLTGRYDEAIAVFGALADAAYRSGMPRQQCEAHLMRGICWFYNGEPRIAATEFEQAGSASINDPRPEFWKGLMHAHQGRYRDAISAYSSSLRLFNGYTLARNNRGLAYLAIGELDFAVADFDEVIRQTPRDPSAYYKRAIALGRRGDLREAVASYDAAIRLDSEYAPSYYNRGLLHRRLGNTQQADADLAKARKLNPQIGAQAPPQRLARR
jgi:tetratricopeptide (TPR) repeat protein